MIRSLLLVSAGTAAGWFAHRALGSLDAPAQARPTSAPRVGLSGGVNPEHLARQAGQAAGDVAAAAVQEGARRLADRLKTDAPPWVSGLVTTATVIPGETVTTPSPSTRGPSTISSTTIRKDPTA